MEEILLFSGHSSDSPSEPGHALPCSDPFLSPFEVVLVMLGCLRIVPDVVGVIGEVVL